MNEALKKGRKAPPNVLLIRRKKSPENQNGILSLDTQKKYKINAS